MTLDLGRSERVRARPLARIVVLDLTTYLSGPFATQLLAGLGADVIKIERPDGGDPSRANPPYLGPDGVNFGHRRPGDISLSMLKRGRGKKSVSLNLQTEGGRELLLRLAAHADVLVENFVPGTLDRLGLSYETLSETNPRLVVASISGFGHTGPNLSRSAFDLVVQARSGAMLVTGEADGPPLRMGVAAGDLVAALYATIAILAALRARDLRGRGEHVDVAMLDCLFSLVMDEAPDVLEAAGLPIRSGNRRTRLTPFNAYPTRDGHVVIATASDAHWQALLRAMDRADLISQGFFSTLEERVARSDDVDAFVTAWTSSHPCDRILPLLHREGIAAAALGSMSDVLADPQLHARDMVLPIEHPTIGPVLAVSTYGFPVRFSESDAGFGAPAPRLGEHTEDVLRERLGLSQEEVEVLRLAGVIGRPTDG